MGEGIRSITYGDDGQILGFNLHEPDPGDRKPWAIKELSEKPKITLPEFDLLFPDDTAALSFFEERLWGDYVCCPKCYGDNVYRTVNEVKPRESHRCRDCRRYFGIRQSTLMRDSKLGAKTWLLAIYHMLSFRRGINSVNLADLLGVWQDTSWYILQRLREAMAEERAFLDGVVQIDEAFIGGKGSNKHASKKSRDAQGNYLDIKAQVFGIRDEGGRVVAFPLWDRSNTALRNAVKRNVAQGAVVYTDGHRAYQYLERLGYDHESVNHKIGEYVREQESLGKKVTTNSIESFWSLVKRGYVGVFYAISWKHLHRYINEYALRLSLGNGNGVEYIGAIVGQDEGQAPALQEAHCEQRAEAAALTPPPVLPRHHPLFRPFLYPQGFSLVLLVHFADHPEKLRVMFEWLTARVLLHDETSARATWMPKTEVYCQPICSGFKIPPCTSDDLFRLCVRSTEHLTRPDTAGRCVFRM